jgi:hypothetical protein
MWSGSASTERRAVVDRLKFGFYLLGWDANQERIAMSDSTIVPGSLSAPVPWREILPWAVFAALALLAIYFVGAEEGATSIIPGMYVHDFVHDGRHLLGFPCH